MNLILKEKGPFYRDKIYFPPLGPGLSSMVLLAYYGLQKQHPAGSPSTTMVGSIGLLYVLSWLVAL